jgi:hypothetical protein
MVVLSEITKPLFPSFCWINVTHFSGSYTVLVRLKGIRGKVLKQHSKYQCMNSKMAVCRPLH